VEFSSVEPNYTEADDGTGLESNKGQLAYATELQSSLLRTSHISRRMSSSSSRTGDAAGSVAQLQDDEGYPRLSNATARHSSAKHSSVSLQQRFSHATGSKDLLGLHDVAAGLPDAFRASEVSRSSSALLSPSQKQQQRVSQRAAADHASGHHDNSYNSYNSTSSPSPRPSSKARSSSHTRLSAADEGSSSSYSQLPAAQALSSARSSGRLSTAAAGSHSFADSSSNSDTHQQPAGQARSSARISARLSAAAGGNSGSVIGSESKQQRASQARSSARPSAAALASGAVDTRPASASVASRMADVTYQCENDNSSPARRGRRSGKPAATKRKR
jgi:hypothetical protein